MKFGIGLDLGGFLEALGLRGLWGNAGALNTVLALAETDHPSPLREVERELGKVKSERDS